MAKDVHKCNTTIKSDEASGNSDNRNVQLKRTVGLTSAVAFIAGTMIGSGIFISPKGVLSSSGSIGLSLIVWALCGILSMMGALSLAELGTLVPKMGGEYAYLLEAFSPLHRFSGPLPAFLYAWISILVLRPSSLAVIALTCSEYILAPIFSDGCGAPPDLYIKLLAAVVVLTISAANCLSVNLSARIQVFFTGAKLLSITLIIVVGVLRIIQGYTEHLHFDTLFEGTETNVGVVALGFYNGLWSFDGWNSLNYVTEEVIKPNRNIPLAIWIAVPLVTVCYLLTNISYFTVMSTQQLLASPAVAVTWGDSVLGSFSWIIPLSVAFSAFGALNGTLFTSGRLNFAAARERHMIKVLSMVDVNRYTPSSSIVFSAITTIVWMMPSGIESLIDVFSFTVWISYGLTMAALLVLRRTQRDKERPYKTNIIYPIIVLLTSVYLVSAPIVTHPQIEFFLPIAFIFLGVFVYVPFVYMKKDFPGITYLTTFIQLFMQVTPSSTE